MQSRPLEAKFDNSEELSRAVSTIKVAVVWLLLMHKLCFRHRPNDFTSDFFRSSCQPIIEDLWQRQPDWSVGGFKIGSKYIKVGSWHYSTSNGMYSNYGN